MNWWVSVILKVALSIIFSSDLNSTIFSEKKTLPANFKAFCWECATIQCDRNRFNGNIVQTKAHEQTRRWTCAVYANHAFVIDMFLVLPTFSVVLFRIWPDSNCVYCVFEWLRESVCHCKWSDASSPVAFRMGNGHIWQMLWNDDSWL